MSDLKPITSAAVIGDLVGSRRATDRAGLHDRLQSTLDAVNEELSPVSPLRVTVGDEYQGAFARVGEALAATLLVRVTLLPDIDVRQGVGWGEARLLTVSPRVEDGSAWWSARAAIEQVEASETRAALRAVRTAYLPADGEPGPDPGVVNAALMLRDERVSGLSARGLSVLRGLLAGRTQEEIAAMEGISASAVSQRVRHDGLGVLRAAHERLGGVG